MFGNLQRPPRLRELIGLRLYPKRNADARHVGATADIAGGTLVAIGAQSGGDWSG